MIYLNNLSNRTDLSKFVQPQGGIQVGFVGPKLLIVKELISKSSHYFAYSHRL